VWEEPVAKPGAAAADDDAAGLTTAH